MVTDNNPNPGAAPSVTVTPISSAPQQPAQAPVAQPAASAPVGQDSAIPAAAPEGAASTQPAQTPATPTEEAPGPEGGETSGFDSFINNILGEMNQGDPNVGNTGEGAPPAPGQAPNSPSTTFMQTLEETWSKYEDPTASTTERIIAQEIEGLKSQLGSIDSIVEQRVNQALQSIQPVIDSYRETQANAIVSEAHKAVDLIKTNLGVEVDGGNLLIALRNAAPMYAQISGIPITQLNPTAEVMVEIFKMLNYNKSYSAPAPGATPQAPASGQATPPTDLSGLTQEQRIQVWIEEAKNR